MDFQRALDLVVLVFAIEASGLGEVQDESDFDLVAIIDVGESHALKPPLGMLDLLSRFQAFRSGRGIRAKKYRREEQGKGLLTHANLLLFGNPLGASRPASARLPRQSRSSALGSFWDRPAGSSQVRPSSSLNAFASESPPSL